jgi:hypothetical protein
MLNTKEIKTLRELETDFSSFIPLGRDKFKESYQMWLTERYGDEFTMKGIDYLEFEINFMLKETAQVVCFQLSGLDEEQADELKEKISQIIGNRDKES